MSLRKDAESLARLSLVATGLTLVAAVPGYFLLEQLKPVVRSMHLECVQKTTGRDSPPDEKLRTDINSRLREMHPEIDTSQLEAMATARYNSHQESWKNAKESCGKKIQWMIAAFP